MKSSNALRKLQRIQTHLNIQFRLDQWIVSFAPLNYIDMNGIQKPFEHAFLSWVESSTRST